MSKLRFVLPGILLLALDVVSPAQVVQKKDGYLISIKFKKGQVIKQNISMVASGNSKLRTNAQVVTKCLEVDSKGVATLEVTMPAAAGKPATKKKMRIDRHGKPLGNTIEGYSGNFMWPEVPMKIGQAWNGNFNLGGTMAGQGKMVAIYKITGIKTVEGVRVAAVSTILDVAGQFDVAGTGMIYVRISDGQMHSATFNVGLKQYSESGAPTVMKLMMTIRTAK